jgi:hypothetical protein
MSDIVYLNGEFMPLDEAKVPVLDRGFIFGDGVYEVIPAYSRHPFRLPEHLRRLQHSLDSIRLANPMTEGHHRAQPRRGPIDLSTGDARAGKARSCVSRGGQADRIHDEQPFGNAVARAD